MAGTKTGSIKAKQTIKETYGEDFFVNIGRKGGRRCVSKGFGKNKELASSAGRKGGLKSKRGKKTEEIEI